MGGRSKESSSDTNNEATGNSRVPPKEFRELPPGAGGGRSAHIATRSSRLANRALEPASA
eukprot:1188889-Prorocentrum_minimum.AAC.1